MSEPSKIDGALVQWGERLFYPANRIVKASRTTRLAVHFGSASARAAAVRERIEATVVRRAPQVMVKVTGGGRGMKAIAAHFRYICKNGRLEIEDDQGHVDRGQGRGPGARRGLALRWVLDPRREPPPGRRSTSSCRCLAAPIPSWFNGLPRDFATSEFADHKYVLVLHDHQANPARSPQRSGRVQARQAAEPAQADLHRWRETFAEKLRVGNRCGSDPTGEPGRRPELPEPLAQEGGRGGQGAPASAGTKDWPERDGEPHGGRGRVGEPLPCLERFRQLDRPRRRRRHRTMGEGTKRRA